MAKNEYGYVEHTVHYEDVFNRLTLALEENKYLEMMLAQICQDAYDHDWDRSFSPELDIWWQEYQEKLKTKKHKIKEGALAKLSAEEREVLGL